MRKAHIERVNKGKCKASLTAPFTNILHLIDRMGNSCINLADVAESGTSMKYFMLEEKLRRWKNSTDFRRFKVRGFF